MDSKMEKEWKEIQEAVKHIHKYGTRVSVGVQFYTLDIELKYYTLSKEPKNKKIKTEVY